MSCLLIPASPSPMPPRPLGCTPPPTPHPHLHRPVLAQLRWNWPQDDQPLLPQDRAQGPPGSSFAELGQGRSEGRRSLTQEAK